MQRRVPILVLAVSLGLSLSALAATGCGARHEAVRPAVAPQTPPEGSPPRAEPQARPPAPREAPARGDADQIGLATWYGSALAGHKTANGERFDPSKLTAAHRKLPFGTWVEVRSVDTGRTVRVRINDRGPWGHADRIIDLSKKAAEELGIVRAGVAKVELRVVSGP
jgi:rare lipoprotein A